MHCIFNSHGQPRSLCLTRTPLFKVLFPSSRQFEGPFAARKYAGKHTMPEKTKTKPSQTPSSSGQVARDKNNVVTISVHTKPESELNAITVVSIVAVGVAIAAPPTDGQANAELVPYLSKVLALKRSEVVVDKNIVKQEAV
uniref:Uncharacterized protein n=1 Tax=Oncorhynchus kisutch TaxID=8019 RepID=A0A8C7K0Y4_ONCKI